MTGGSYGKLLRNGGFQGFLWTQFLGALNDNIYKTVTSMLAVELAVAGNGGEYVSLAGAVFVAPFLLFSGYAGHLADSRNKRSVLISTKAMEVVTMLLAVFAFLSLRVELLLGVLFLLALQATLFSPAKYGIVPEMLPDHELSRANGLLEMTTFVAIVLGSSSAGLLLWLWKTQPVRIGWVVLAIAVAGSAASLRIGRVPGPVAREPFHLNPFAEVLEGFRRLREDRPLLLTVLGISYFWFLGALFQMDLVLLGSEELRASDLHTSLTLASLAIGIGVGSLLAGWLSGDKIELGLVPLGALGLGGFSLALSAAVRSTAASCFCLAALGIFGGAFAVPLNALLQQRAGKSEKGRLIATNNFLNMVGMLLASGLLWFLHSVLGFSPSRIILAAGILTLLATAYSIRLLPAFFIRFILWALTHSVYRIRVIGRENIPARGPALIVANHVSLVDGLLIGASLQRFVRFMIYRPYYEMKLFRPVFRLLNAIPVSNSPRDAVEAIRRARLELQGGHLVCIFPEGSVTRTGSLLPFKHGFEKIAKGMNIPVIPVYLDGVWGSIFSFERGRVFWKWPKRIPYDVTVSFGAPRPAGVTAHEIREAVMEEGAAASALRKTINDLADRHFIRTAKRNWFRLAMADSGGRELTYGRALTASLLLSSWLRRERSGDAMIGVLLPASCGGALANLAIALAGKASVNLNFTAGKAGMEHAIGQSGIRTILTSRQFLARARIEALPGTVFLEEVLSRTTPVQKILTAARAILLPARLLSPPRDPGSLATVIFSSGTTGVPKGVMLSHRNLLANIESMAQVFNLTKADRFAGTLPPFHVFGLACTVWFPLVRGFSVVYHPNPAEALAIGALIAKYRATFLMTAPTFAKAYVRRCDAKDFASIRIAVVGAEKLRDPLPAEFRDKFGIELLEGYGCTEMSPGIAGNVPDFDGAEKQAGHKAETVGRPFPGVAVKVVDPETFQPLGEDREGLLLVKGPNLMLGYLGQPEKTAAAIRDGWYVTGDIGAIDEEGFLRLTDRLSRFSKIAGEMVPHAKVEEEIARITGDGTCAVTGVPDGRRGERLVALYTRADITSGELWTRLTGSGLPNLWIPKKEDLRPVSELPLLGSGKLDLKRVAEIARASGADRDAGHTAAIPGPERSPGAFV